MSIFDAVMGNTVGKAATIDFGIQWACWAVAALLRTEKFYDLAGSATTLYLAYQSLKWGRTYYTRQKVQTGLVMTWAVRLGCYLFMRVLKDGRDRRFNNVRDKPAMFWLYWTIQAVWVLVNLLPLLLLNEEKEDSPLQTRDYVGWALWALGFIFEVVADRQKSVFNSDPKNKGKFITSGLWAISRHPNYFGEICMWTGIFLSSSSVFKTPAQYGSVISPLFIAFLLIKVSGIPLLEKSAARRWGSDPAFQQYMKNTAKLIPFIW